MKWSELDNGGYYNKFDENEKAIKGFWLTTQKIDLENLPENFNEKFEYFDTPESSNYHYEERKVYLKDIVGTCYQDYGNMNIIKAYIRIKRASRYITEGVVTKSKYNRMLRKSVGEQNLPVTLFENTDGTLFVEGNGNHRIVLYKMMMLSEIATNKEKSLKEIEKSYWLYAKVKVANS